MMKVSEVFLDKGNYKNQVLVQEVCLCTARCTALCLWSLGTFPSKCMKPCDTLNFQSFSLLLYPYHFRYLSPEVVETIIPSTSKMSFMYTN